jgi:hypothetical protein
MLDKIKEKIMLSYLYTCEKASAVLDTINEIHLTGVVALVATAVTYYAYQSGDPNLQEMSKVSMRLSTFMLYVFSLFKFLGTRKMDVWSEIIDQHNVAYGYVLSALILGGAACIFL